jgi:hypothetical protein
MELLLNLVWVLLAVPACFLWQRTRRRFSSLQCLLTLGCALVLLFPVISATDDLHAMRPEMEESSPGKRTFRQAGSDKESGEANFGAAPALLTSLLFDSPRYELCGEVAERDLPICISDELSLSLGRAPPMA